MIAVSHSLDPYLLVIGGGPAGATAALDAARAGYPTLLLDAAAFPRDKACGDGLTPRAVHQLRRRGLFDSTPSQPGSRHRNRGLKLHGFGGSCTAAWPDSRFGRIGSAMSRLEFDALLLDAARAAGADVRDGVQVTDVEVRGGYATQVMARGPGGTLTVRPHSVIVADGVRSPVGKLLGRRWHRSEVHGIAARAYCASPGSDESWIHSHLELRDPAGQLQPGYGWIFPLGDGRVNIGAGALSTAARPARVNTKKLLHHYAQSQREAWRLGPEQHVASALLPMGGAVSTVAGANWMLIGDAAACVNPLNGEGIDYALETAGLAVGLLGTGRLTGSWPALLRETYGESFTLARLFARALTHPRLIAAGGRVAMRELPRIMPAIARLMGNLVTEDDRDLAARLWRAGGGLARRCRRTPLWD